MYCEIQGLSNGNVSIVYYDSSYCFLSRNIIEAELPVFGGFYEGQDNYYVVWGQENKNESDSVEVMRVVKYDKYWNTYYIKAYTTDGVQEYYSSESNIMTVPAMNDSTGNEDDVKPTASPTPKPSSHPDANNETNSIQELEKGSKIADKNTKAVYKVTENGENTAVEYVMSTLKNPTNISVPASVKLKGKIYKVTSIGKAALKNSKKLKTIKIGKNVKKIGRQASSPVLFTFPQVFSLFGGVWLIFVLVCSWDAGILFFGVHF